jgi:hypothetical protein
MKRGFCVQIYLVLFPLLNSLVSSAEDPDQEISQFPVCVVDADCDNISWLNSADYRCFQYRCFPWKDPGLQGEFRSCSKNDECSALMVAEGGDGCDGLCLRHPDRRNVFMGICVKARKLSTGLIV